MKLRVHHLLCVPLYTGHGYSREFTDNMDHKAEQLRNGCRVILQTQPDEICASCPNLCWTPGDLARCSLDANEVQTKDEKLLQALQIQEEHPYDSAALWEHIRGHMTRVIFENSCSGCSWYQKGYCSYEKYEKEIERLTGRGK